MDVGEPVLRQDLNRVEVAWPIAVPGLFDPRRAGYQDGAAGQAGRNLANRGRVSR